MIDSQHLSACRLTNVDLRVSRLIAFESAVVFCAETRKLC